MSRRKKAARRKIKKTPYLGIVSLLVLLTITFIATIYLVFLRPGTLQKPIKKTSHPIEHPQQIIPAISLKKPQKIDKAPLKPQIAIIIDDIGYQRKIAEQFIQLDLNLNFSILPHSPNGLSLATKARDMGRDILLHLPMEATASKWKPGPGALFLDMKPAERDKTLLDDFQAVPMAIGVNNHMGSRYTEDKEAMGFVLQEIKKRDLFFIDSLTTPHSVGYKLAKTLSIKTAKRDVFIDNNKDKASIIKQLEHLVQIAQKYGQAVGIGHPHKATLAALRDSSKLLTDTVSLVAIHKIVR